MNQSRPVFVYPPCVDRQAIERRKAELIRRHGPWVYSIPLGEGLWTTDAAGEPHGRLHRLVQAAADLAPESLAELRVLDLACLEGQFALEFARHGCQVVGIEGRPANVEKAEFAKQVLGIDRVRFIVDDVRRISAERYGQFDIVLCSGILYHLAARDIGPFLDTLAAMTLRVLIVDTHVSLTPEAEFGFEGQRYHGRTFREHGPGDTAATIESRTLASLDNPQSFWLTRPSLLNMLERVGFTSLYECFNPPSRGGADRCTFVALQGRPVTLYTSPPAERPTAWSEDELGYAAGGRRRGWLARLGRKLRGRRSA